MTRSEVSLGNGGACSTGGGVFGRGCEGESHAARASGQRDAGPMQRNKLMTAPLIVGSSEHFRIPKAIGRLLCVVARSTISADQVHQMLYQVGHLDATHALMICLFSASSRTMR